MTRTDFFRSFEEGEPAPGTTGGVPVRLGAGPERSPTAKPLVGYTGLRALQYEAPPGPATTTLFDVDIPVTPDTELSYVVFPESGPGTAGPDYHATFLAIDLEFADGGRLSELELPDHHGFVLSAAAQGAAKTLYLDQWNRVAAGLGAAAGRTIRAILLTTAAPAPAGGWVDDIRIAARPPEPGPAAVDQVRTTRGTHSSGEFSRGNTFPATAVPHGFNFWTPVTDAGALNWLYEYHRGNNPDNLPALQAFALSHQPSPWMGDRHTFQVMPGTGEVTLDRAARALAFAHEDEIDRPHHYGVRFACGITADLAPADHAALLRFRFPSGAGWLVFDNTRNRGGLRVHPAKGIVTGHTWVRSRLSAGARRMYVYATFDRPATGGGRLRRPCWRRVSGYLTFRGEVVSMRIATSLISLRQARRNLELEIPEGTSFEQVRAEARRAWQDLLGRVELEGAGTDQLTSFYSGLYRLFLYPNSGHENTGTRDRPRIRHASPVIRRWCPSTRLRTGAKVLDGPMYVNNGFWDTYRTAWPAYALLAPERCAELIEGFVRQYREGGWVSRWSSPGYADLMTGTSSDVAFADAYLKGVRGFDVEAAYDAALRNATVTPPHRAVGRKGLAESIFLGYTPDSTPEGVSWALEGCLNDFGLANWSRALAESCAPGHPRRAEYLANAEYFGNRALQYVHHFDTRTGFFAGRATDGSWRRSPAAHDPLAWGFGHTETNAWNAAFSAPHDGKGLANLHGGRAGLAAKLDEFFATRETGLRPGTYGGVIHEMTEARDIRLGQYGHSNQPSHHIPYVYYHAGAPAKAQRIVREVLARCYLGSELGQGYPGDEDNGEMSAWYVFSALGLYPLQVGSPRYVLGSPLFTRATLRLPGGAELVINAPRGGKDDIYVRGARLDGEPLRASWISHARLAAGGTLDIDLGPEPGAWGTGEQDAPPSLTTGDAPPAPLTDLPGAARCLDGTDVAALRDDTTATEVRFRTRTPVLEYTVDGAPRTVRLYTLTSGARRGDPRSWVLEGSADGHAWTVLDERTGEVFRWRKQTRAFTVSSPAAYRHYRLRVTAGSRGRIGLAQWELLAGQGGP
ncbi:GH92 family glycosyl hydrolase [Amycolatopsis aidingensis]|uniref:GH92 family glycosyl hydrolase n=1 Tax=Amycolatopsis aidingensis TaxID=2842453 RepID=UPI001C0CB909|nr:GH92 family glycosyl hydrolase [Amycolatopsis aidingensis]